MDEHTKQVLSLKYQNVMIKDENGLPFESDIVDIADLISKTDIPIDITSIHPTSLDNTQNLCDVIHQLHGDQQQERQQLAKLSARNLQQITSRNNEQLTSLQSKQILSNNYHNAMQHSGEYGKSNQPSYVRKCPTTVSHQSPSFSSLPDSPPDSGSEPYSPPQEGKVTIPEGFMHRISGFNFGSGQIKEHFTTTPPYDSSPPQNMDTRLNMDSKIILSSPISNSYTNASEPQYTTINASQLGLYSEEDNSYENQEQAKSVSTLSPVSNISDSSVRSNNSTVSYVGAPATKKRKHSESPTTLQLPSQLSTSMLKQQYKFLIQQTIKQEPGLDSSPNNEGRNAFINEAFETNESKPKSSSGSNSSTIRIPVQQHPLLSGNTKVVESRSQESSAHTSRQAPLTTGLLTPHYTDSSNTYQVIKWSSFHSETWTSLYDVTGKELQTVTYRVDADKGFNFAVADDTFVCQKKNHFQVTVHIGVVGHPYYVKTEDGLKPLEAFYINLYGVKYESQNQSIAIEQSQSDRSKKPFHPVKVDLPGDQVTKVTIGRLHFSETTTNNMRKKGRPNPDQRYFLCIVALHAHAGGRTYSVAASATEKIIVRASNPGQFDQDDIQWQRGQASDAIYHNGRVGVNYDHPDEALVVHGNLKLTGHLMQPSDQRAKQDIEEVDTKAQLKNVQNIRICRYKYSPEYAKYAGIDSNREETGVIAQEFAEVIPEAVKESGEVALPNGEVIPNFLVVDKDRLYMENVGAVKELCKVTGGFEERIDELERWNKKLAKLKLYDSIRSRASVVSGYSTSSSDTGGQNDTRSTQANDRTSQMRNPRARKQFSSDGFCCFNNKNVSATVVILLVVMTVCMTILSVLYMRSHKEETTGNQNSNFAIGMPQYLPTNYTGSPYLLNYISSDQTFPQSPSPSTSLKYPTPITYCSLGMVVCSQPSSIYCCSTDAVGAPLETTCLHDLSMNIPGLKQPSVATDDSKAGTRFGSSNILKSRGYNYKSKYRYHNSKYKHPSIHRSHPDGNGNDVINQGTKALKYHQSRLNKKIPAILESIDQNHDENSGTRKRNPRSVTLPSLTVHNEYVKEISLVEPNVILYNRSAEEQPYVSCAFYNQSYAFNIPISHMTPPATSMTLQFKLAKAVKVVLCSVPTRNITPCSLSISGDESVSVLNSSIASEANFILYLSNYVEGNYDFRIASVDQTASDICNASFNRAKMTYVSYTFHVYRVCPGGKG